MAAFRALKTSFPTVLKQYLPEQESTDDNVTSPDDPEHEAEETEEQPHRAKSVRVTEDIEGQGKKVGGSPQKGARGPPKRTHGPQPPPRQFTSLSFGSTGSGRRSDWKRQEAEQERLEHVADAWDQARAEVLSERHGQLQEKVLLQHKLVKAQDRHALKVRQRKEEREALKRQEEKQRKQSKEAELQDICRQSLDADKKAASEQRRAVAVASVDKRSTAVSTPTALCTPSSAHSSGDGSDHTHNSDDSGGAGRAPRAPPRHPGYRPSMALPEQHLRSTAMKELEDEGEEEEVEVRQGSAAGKEERAGGMPAHHAQLYQLYGKQADYFLHPKPAPPAHNQRRQTHPKLKNQRAVLLHSESGHIGAGELWDTLRKDSKSKLIRNDSRFPQELKSAFSAFVRERLTKHSCPVERSFCATEDVPDIQRLMDQSKLRRTRLYRHKTELMYRSSVNNMDRTSILLHNNPMPLTSETGQADSISRYLPSWVDDHSEVSEAEYMKWVRARKEELGEEEEEDTEEDKENARHSAHSRQLSETTNELQNIWHAIAARKKKPRTPRYQFLTEKAAECEGAFSQKFQEEKEQREKPQPHYVAKSYSALEFSHPSSSFSVPPSRERGRSAHTSMQLQRYQSDWQPLSMTALVEYKKQMDAEGQGDFDHGRVKMWPALTSSVG